MNIQRFDVDSCLKCINESLETLYEYGNKIISRIEHKAYDITDDHEYDDEDQFNREIYSRNAEICVTLMLTLCKKIELDDILNKLTKEWKYDDIFNVCVIPLIGDIELSSYKALSRIMTMISASIGAPKQVNHRISTDMSVLMRILRNAPMLITKFGISVSSESDIQKFYDNLLPCIFPFCKTKPSMTSPLKNYIPDYGIIDIKTLIEFKYINSPSDVGKTVDEVCSDMKNYSRSEDWKIYIAVFYCNANYITEEKMIAQFASINCDDQWIPILTVGPGK